MQIHISPELDQIYPGASCGFLTIQNVTNPALAPALEARKAALQADLRARYPDADRLKADPVLQVYAAYYKNFRKSYHVGLQLESVALKGKSLPTAAALVDCMFMAELDDRLLTAGHDLAALQGDITVDVAQGSETYTLLRGTQQQLKPGDLFMQDEAGVISSIIYGPDARTQISPSTTAVLFCVYAPPGIGTQRVQAHLSKIAELVRLSCPGAQVGRARVY